jgi:SAM-dependent methyltransferase
MTGPVLPRLRRFVKRAIGHPGQTSTGVITCAQGMAVGDPVSFNSKRGMDAFFADDDRIGDYLGPERLAFYRMLLDFIPCNAGDRVLDFGCGPGTLLEMLRAAHEIQPVATDQSEIVGRYLRARHAHLPFVASDIYNPPFEPGSFDLVIATEVLEHLLYPARAMERLLALLRPHGRFFATVPDGRADTFAGHINFWSFESFGVFLEPFGPATVGRLPDGTLYAVVTPFGERAR